jgi:hypothetical protein
VPTPIATPVLKPTLPPQQPPTQIAIPPSMVQKPVVVTPQPQVPVVTFNPPQQPTISPPTVTTTIVQTTQQNKPLGNQVPPPGTQTQQPVTQTVTTPTGTHPSVIDGGHLVTGPTGQGILPTDHTHSLVVHSPQPLRPATSGRHEGVASLYTFEFIEPGLQNRKVKVYRTNDATELVYKDTIPLDQGGFQIIVVGTRNPDYVH